MEPSWRVEYIRKLVRRDVSKARSVWSQAATGPKRHGARQQRRAAGRGGGQSAEPRRGVPAAGAAHVRAGRPSSAGS